MRTPPSAEPWTALLAECLDGLAGRMGRERLGYLAATSMVELQVRDELAFALHERALGTGKPAGNGRRGTVTWPSSTRPVRR